MSLRPFFSYFVMVASVAEETFTFLGDSVRHWPVFLVACCVQRPVLLYYLAVITRVGERCE